MKKYFVAVLFFLALATACRKEIQPSTSFVEHTPADSLTLAQVQTWYSNPPTTNTTLQTQSTRQTFSLKKLSFDWSKAGNIRDTKRNWWMVSLPGQPTFQNVKQGYRKLAFVRDSTGALEAHILEIIPDIAYLHRHHGAHTQTFTGQVFVYNEHYQLLYGWILHDGKKVGLIKAQPKATTAATTGTNPKIKTDMVAISASCDWIDANYIDSEGEVNIYAYQLCDYTIYDDGFYPDGGGGGGGVPSGDPLGGGGGGGGEESTAPPAAELPGNGNPAINPKAFINCFGSLPDDGAKETITVYVQEPQPGLPFNIGVNSVGHTAISLTKASGGQTITQTVGFYPGNSLAAASGTPAKVVDNSQTPYTVSITYNVLPFEFNAIASYIANPPATYNLYTFNCTNFVYNACQQGNITLPDPTANLGLFVTGMSPAALGASIRNVAPDMNVNTNGGAMGPSHGPCN